MKKPTKLPRDTAQRAKAILDIATGAVEPEQESPKDPRMQAAGRLGGSEGGQARARNLSPEQRKEAARKAARARWAHKP